MKIIEPKTPHDFENYYLFRWEILRHPWLQPPGSEKDEHDIHATHRMIIDNNDQVIAIGRLHFIDDKRAQVRYMAVSDKNRGKGLGSAILCDLESYAFSNKATSIILHAREEAVPFYKKHGYMIKKPSHLLYGKIQHYLMIKEL